MTQLCTIAVWTNREMTQLKQKSHGGQGLVTPPLFVYCERLSSPPLFATTQARLSNPQLESVCRTGLPSRGNHVSLEPLACLHVDVSSRATFFTCLRRAEMCVCVWAVCFSLVPSLFWCAFRLFSPRPDKLAAVRPPDTDWLTRSTLTFSDMFLQGSVH